MYAIGYTVATCFDRKRPSSGQYLNKMFFIGLMMTVYGRNM